MGSESTNSIVINSSPSIPPMTAIKDKTKIDVRYMLISPYVSAHIHWDSRINEVVYELEEPALNDKEKEDLANIEKAMMEIVNINIIVEKTQEAMISYINQTAKMLMNELSLRIDEAEYNKLFYYLYRDFIGLSKIEALARDYFIEDIECNGFNTPIYVVHRVYRNMKTNVMFGAIDELASFVEKLAQRCGKYISYASPILDGSLPDGSRVNATYTQDISSRGPTFTIRKFTKIPWTPTQLISMRTVSPEMLAYLWLLMQYKGSLLISGGTASGKTTMLNAISFFIPPEARVVSIEDSVTGDSKLIIRQGSKTKNITIKEFVEKRIDAEVMTIDGKGNLLWIKPLDYLKHHVTKDIYEVLTSTGRRIKVTQDHSLFTLGSDNSFKETKPLELVSGESFVAVPRVLHINGEEVKEINLLESIEKFKDFFLQGKPLARILNKYNYKDLKVAKERKRWWKNHDIIKIEEFLKLDEGEKKFSIEELKQLKIKTKNTASVPVLFPLTDRFLEFCGLWLGDGSYDNHNKNAVIVSNVDKECVNLIKEIAAEFRSGYSAMNDGGVSIRIHNSALYRLMKYIIGLDGYSNTKKIPDFIFNLSNEQIKHFIKGYFSADGCVKSFEVSCSSQSLDLLEDLQSLLLRFGIISRLNDFNRSDRCVNMSISSWGNISKFWDIGFLQERKNLKLETISRKSTHAHSDVVPMSIEKIKELKRICNARLCSSYVRGVSNLGRDYLQTIAPAGSEFNDISHNDILWDRVKSVKKVSSEAVEVFDLSIPCYEKFLCNNIFVHNTREINLFRENWLPSVVRGSVGAGQIGEVNMFSLLRSSFRQNPDYVIVGEVRGEEASVLFQGMASGHSSVGTVHADSVDTLIKRLETPPINLSPTLINTLDVVAIMTHAIVNKQETRKLREIVEIVNVDPNGVAVTNTPFVWNAREDNFYFKKSSKAFEKISTRFGLSNEELEREFRVRTLLLNEMVKRKIFRFEEVQDIINHYYKDPATVLAAFEIKV